MAFDPPGMDFSEAAVEAMVNPDRWVMKGYAHLIELLALTCNACPTCGRYRRWFDPTVKLWQAEVAFNTARILAEGGNPWTRAR